MLDYSVTQSLSRMKIKKHEISFDYAQVLSSLEVGVASKLF